MILSAITACVDFIIGRATGSSLFMFFGWHILPIGSFFLGLISAFGYYFIALYFNKKPDILLIIQIVIMAGFTQFLIYYITYFTLTINNGTMVRDIIPFMQYLHLKITETHYVARGNYDVGVMGIFGYLFALIQFIGLVSAPISMMLSLEKKDACSSCNKYFKTIARKTKRFSEKRQIVDYYINLFQHHPKHIEFAKIIQKTDPSQKLKSNKFHMRESLLGCPECQSQMITHSVVFENKKSLSGFSVIDDLNHKLPIPKGSDMTTVFNLD